MTESPSRLNAIAAHPPPTSSRTLPTARRLKPLPAVASDGHVPGEPLHPLRLLLGLNRADVVGPPYPWNRVVRRHSCENRHACKDSPGASEPSDASDLNHLAGHRARVCLFDLRGSSVRLSRNAEVLPIDEFRLPGWIPPGIHIEPESSVWIVLPTVRDRQRTDPRPARQNHLHARSMHDPCRRPVMARLR